MKCEKSIRTLSLEGRAIACFLRKGLCKYVLLETAEGLHRIKLAKDLRATVQPAALEGSRVRLFCEEKIKYKSEEKIKHKYEEKTKYGKGDRRLKARTLEILQPSATAATTEGAIAISLREDFADIPVTRPFPASLAMGDRPETLEVEAPEIQSPTQTSETEKSPKSPKQKKLGQILICKKSSCRKRGGDRVCAAFEEALQERGLAERVAIRQTGCMKECKRGPAVVVMPDKKRYTGIAATAIPQLVDRHFSGQQEKSS